MQYLVDENLSKSEKFLKEHPEFVNVKNVMRPGVEDDLIIQKALTGNFIIITKDIRLTLHSLIRGVKVWYFDVEGNREYKLSAQVLQEF